MRVFANWPSECSGTLSLKPSSRRVFSRHFAALFPKESFQRSLSLVCPARYRDSFIDTLFKDLSLYLSLSLSLSPPLSLLYVKRLPSALLRKQSTLLSPPGWVPSRTAPCSPGLASQLAVNKGLLFLFQRPHCPSGVCSGSA